MSDFHLNFQMVSDFVDGAARSVMSRLDHFTFKMLIDCLKSEDYEAASTALDQIAKEKRTAAIPPVYFVSRAHPNMLVREKAMKTLESFDNAKEIARVTEGKSIEEAVKALIEHFGNYRQ